jgi:hypothetical protein
MVSPDQLAVIADDLNLLRMQPDASVSYDLLSDSLQWSDEIPLLGRHKPSNFWCLRLLFRYRMTMILQNPEAEFVDYWVRGKELFPNWAGFHPSRCSPNIELLDLYHTRKFTGMKSLEQ